MKNRLFRIFSFAVAVILIVTSFPLFASAASFNQIVNAATEIIMKNEGNYTTVVRNDNGSLSIGKICWHGTNALSLLKDIVSKKPTQAFNILGATLYNEVITYSSWETKIPTITEASAIAVLLSTSESHEVQDETAWKYISNYVKHGQSLGITEPEALVFFADYENQNGRTGAANFYYSVKRTYNTVNLINLYQASSKNSRRTRTYNFCAALKWTSYSDSPLYEKDKIAPEISNVVVSDITSKGYTVSCSASDNSKLSEIYFAVFHLDDGSEKAKWFKQETDSSARLTVDISEFGNRAGGYCTYIYAFDEAGNYSYVQLNTITVPDSTPAVQNLSITVSAESDNKVGGKIRWRASTSGGSGSYLYTFELFRDGKLIDKTNYSDFYDFEHLIETTGSYNVKVSVYDNVSGKTASVSSAQTDIFTPIAIESFDANTTDVLFGESVFWTVKASDGEGSLKYSYTLYKDGTAIYSTDYKENDVKFAYKPTDTGVYNATVNIMDSRSQVMSAKSQDISVTKPLSADNVSFSTDYAVAGKTVTCTADISGGTGDYSCKFSIYCDGELVVETENLYTSEYSFIISKAGIYTAEVMVTDAETTVTGSSAGELLAEDKARTGDSNCDGKLTASDARIALRCAAGLDPVDENFLYAIDVNADGIVTAADARKILRVVSQIDTF